MTYQCPQCGTTTHSDDCHSGTHHVYPPGLCTCPADDDGPLYADLFAEIDDVLLPGDEEPDQRPVTLADMGATGASYRQLDHWVRKGWLTPTYDRDGGGSGYARQWSPRDLHVAHLMVRLIRSGIATRHAARIATDAVDHGVGSVTTEEGVTVSWKPVSPWKDPIA